MRKLRQYVFITILVPNDRVIVCWFIRVKNHAHVTRHGFVIKVNIVIQEESKLRTIKAPFWYVI